MFKLLKLKTTSFFLCISFLFLSKMSAQELNFQVKVVNPQTLLADPKVFQSLEAAMRELVNNTKWTDDVFEQNERLTGTIQLTIKEEKSATNFSGQLAITAERPIYGTDRTTPIIITLDAQLDFSYEQFQPLQFVKNNFTENLGHTLAYYIHLILGASYDTFSPLGGEVFYQTAQDIFNLVPTSTKGEWQGRELGNKSRYWYVENILSPRLKNFRQAQYSYHRQGLDYASQDMTRCKAAILQSLESIEEAQQNYPNTLVVRIFAQTKTDELVGVFKGATPEQKTRFIEIMARLDPANGPKFRQVGF
jgi:hypothetical protein